MGESTDLFEHQIVYIQTQNRISFGFHIFLICTYSQMFLNGKFLFVILNEALLNIFVKSLTANKKIM